jgi:serine O-acetyltransferase
MNKSERARLSELLKLDLSRQCFLLRGTNNFKMSTWWWLKLCSPRFLPVLFYRLAYQFHQCKLGFLARLFSIINVLFFGIEISTRCKIGPGLFFPHTQGTVLGAVSIGDNAVIYHGVTLGAKNLDFTYDAAHRPTIGHNVIIGAGAKVLGGVHVADNVIIGANSVVTKSIASNQTVAGNPAKNIGSGK